MYSTLSRSVVYSNWFKWECLHSSCGASFSFSCKSHNAIINGMVSNFQALTSRSLRWTLFSSVQSKTVKSNRVYVCEWVSESTIVPFDYYYHSTAYVQNEKNSVHIYLFEWRNKQNAKSSAPTSLSIISTVWQFVWYACVDSQQQPYSFPIDMIFGDDIEYHFRQIAPDNNQTITIDWESVGAE